MTIAEVLLQDYDTEISNTRRTIERVPAEKSDWAPHEKSMPMGKLAMHCATMTLFGHYLLEDEGMDLADPNPKRTHADLTFTTTAAQRHRGGQAVALAPQIPGDPMNSRSGGLTDLPYYAALRIPDGEEERRWLFERLGAQFLRRRIRSGLTAL